MTKAFLQCVLLVSSPLLISMSKAPVSEESGDLEDPVTQIIAIPQGERGPQSIQVVTGPQGPIGPQGERGLQGEIGPQGERGLQGIQGATGAPGEKGAIGGNGVEIAVSRIYGSFQTHATRSNIQNSTPELGSYRILPNHPILFNQNNGVDSPFAKPVQGLEYDSMSDPNNLQLGGIGQFKIPKTGDYLINWGGSFEDDLSQFCLSKNGVKLKHTELKGSLGLMASTTVFLSLKKGDKLSVVNSNRENDLVLNSSSSGALSAFFNIFMLGPNE